MSDSYIVMGHSHALYKAEDLRRETGREWVVRRYSSDESWRKGASWSHYLVEAAEYEGSR